MTSTTSGQAALGQDSQQVTGQETVAPAAAPQPQQPLGQAKAAPAPGSWRMFPAESVGQALLQAGHVSAWGQASTGQADGITANPWVRVLLDQPPLAGPGSVLHAAPPASVIDAIAERPRKRRRGQPRLPPAASPPSSEQTMLLPTWEELEWEQAVLQGQDVSGQDRPVLPGLARSHSTCVRYQWAMVDGVLQCVGSETTAESHVAPGQATSTWTTTETQAGIAGSDTTSGQAATSAVAADADVAGQDSPSGQAGAPDCTLAPLVLSELRTIHSGLRALLDEEPPCSEGSGQAQIPGQAASVGTSSAWARPLRSGSLASGTGFVDLEQPVIDLTD